MVGEDHLVDETVSGTGRAIAVELQHGIGSALHEAQIAIGKHRAGIAPGPADHLIDQKIDRDKVRAGRSCVEIGNAIRHKRGIDRHDHEHIGARFAVKRVNRRTCREVEEGIVAVAAVKRSRSAQGVVAVAAAQHIVADEIDHAVIAASADDRVIPAGSCGFVKSVVAIAADQHVVACAAAQNIVAIAAIDRVGGRLSGQDILAQRADVGGIESDDRAITIERQRLEIAQRISAFQKARSRDIGDTDRSVIQPDDIIVRAAPVVDRKVRARAAIEAIIAIVPPDPVAEPASRQRIGKIAAADGNPLDPGQAVRSQHARIDLRRAGRADESRRRKGHARRDEVRAGDLIDAVEGVNGPVDAAAANEGVVPRAAVERRRSCYHCRRGRPSDWQTPGK